MTRRQRKAKQRRCSHAKSATRTMLDPNWTPQAGYSHAWSIVQRLLRKDRGLA